MASSVARMPPDNWRHHLHPPKPLRKVITRISPAAGASAEPCSQATASRRRQSQILDRWAARQARELITTIERQAYEAELSALSNTTQPVSARAASFLRETSPAFSDSSAASMASGGSAPADIPPNVRASSLIQMWRELEAEAGIGPTQRASAGAAADPASRKASAAEELSGRSDASVDWGLTEPYASSVAENEMEWRKVDEIVKISSLGISSCDEEEVLTVTAPLAMDERQKAPEPARATFPASTASEKYPQEIEDLAIKMEQERRQEVTTLAERHPVSRFPFRGRIQSLIRLRSLRREVAAIRHQQQSRKLEAERSHSKSSNLFFREISEDRSQYNVDDVDVEESTSTWHDLLSDTQEFQFSDSVNLSDSEIPQFTESVTSKDLESSPQTFYSPQTFFTPLSKLEDLHESHSLDASWDRRNLWTIRNEVLETDTSDKEKEITTMGSNCLSRSSYSLGKWEGTSHNFCDDLYKRFTDKQEFHELLARKTVSSSLVSSFSDKLNKLIMSMLHKQVQSFVGENHTQECEEPMLWGRNYADSSVQDVSASSLVPQSSQLLLNQENRQNSSFAENLSESLQAGSSMQDLRNDIAEIHHEISDLRKLAESCMEWQINLEHLIRQEVFSAVNQLVGAGNYYKWMPRRKDYCCICCEVQVDSVLFRCGHMCACYNCAQELQHSIGRCPICRSIIIDVIRAYWNA
ncbi:putative E3 ubiquitin-protein ligase XBOS34 [Apostasia shenzhenica]|uniref:Putative E3 ubiquitin-protein ligase XBOS34 n=1 Tax=Apostasia shenzhenica TaxID=1088818 RepID=A0A2I0AAJ5_9ASPA|nr:putative E3 ubiquitin-protein ligase XBOS34 [Apostasia shenzhenica]